MTVNLDNWDLSAVPTIFICIFFPLFIYATYWFFVTGIIGAVRMLKSNYWSPVIGKTTNAEIRFSQIGSSSDDISFKFVIKKTYRYTLHGQNYESSQTHASDSLYSKEFKPMSKFSKKYAGYKTNPNYLEAESRLKHLIGTPVTVYYDPKKPHIACLVNGFDPAILLPIIMGLVFGTGITYLTYCLIKPFFN